jgi:Leucine-rich repeat (LRR) protein
MVAKRHTPAFAFALAVLFSCQSAWKPIFAAEPTNNDLNQWVKNLSSADFSVRQQAVTNLEGAGAEVIPMVAAQLDSTDREVRSRAFEVLLSHALSLRMDRRKAALAELTRLANSSEEERASSVAKIALAKIRELTTALAAGELTRLGATVMPVEGADPPKYNVQIPQKWLGGDDRLSRLTDLADVPFLSMENAPVTDASLVHVARLTNLTKLYLGSTRLTGRYLDKLAPLKQLQYLSLRQLPIDDAKLRTLPTFSNLQYFGLDGTQIGNEGLKELRRFPKLQTLWLDQTQITDAGLVHFKALLNLRTLFLPGTKTTGPGLAELRHLPALTYLSLKGTKLTDDSLKHVGQIEQLETLGLDHTNVTDDQLADLAGLSQLRILWLSKTEITDAGIEHLKSLKNLQVVYLHGSQVSSDAAADLQRAIPNCHVAR